MQTATTAMRTRPLSLDLFAEPIEEAPQPEAGACAIGSVDGGEQPAPQGLAETYRRLWQACRSDLEARASSEAERAEVERKALLSLGVHDDHLASFPAPHRDYVETELRDLARKMFERLVSVAEKVFAPTGTRLEISLGEVKERFPAEPNRGEFDPAALWEYLEQTYSGQSGRDLAWNQLARGLARKLGINKEDREVEVKAGAVVLRQHISLDSIDKKYSGENKLSISSMQSVGELMVPFSGFARWAERTALAEDFNHFAQHWWEGRRRIESRRRFELGNGCEVVVVTFNTHFEYRLRADVAEQLQIFIGSYAN